MKLILTVNLEYTKVRYFQRKGIPFAEIVDKFQIGK